MSETLPANANAAPSSLPTDIRYDASTLVPKLATLVTMALTPNHQIMMTFMYGEDKDRAAIIERVLIDLNLAQFIHSALTEAFTKLANLPAIGADEAPSADEPEGESQDSNAKS